MTSLVERLADSAKGMGIASVYGEPITLGTETLVPVALAYYGFGGGSEVDGPEAQEGGGGGGAALPIGAYVTNEAGRVRFQPNLISLLGVAVPLVWVSGRALSRVIRALKK